jgi:hypothetical protein
VSPPAAVEFEQRLTELEAVPLTLLPVRLETRFIPAEDAPVELRVRVYPDQVQLDAHQPGLTDAEVAAGQVYWRNRWRPATAERAWPELIRGIRPARAAWIVRSLTPLNPIGDPAGPRFPQVAARKPGLDVPLAVRAMPTRWVALGWDERGREVLRRWFDNPVADGLRATASLTEGPEISGDAAVNAYLGWAADYGAAIAAGMAVTIRPADLPAGRSLADGFARFAVLGVDWTADSAGSAAELAALLSAHEVSDGLGYLKPGTPTNNVSADAAAGGAIEVADPAAPAPNLKATWSAGSRLARALGTERPSVNSMHHQAIGKVAPCLATVARAPDGIVEGVEWPTDDWWMVGVQWHPEELWNSAEPWDRDLFAAFVEVVRRGVAVS